MSEQRCDITLTVNGETVIETVDARKTLVDFLRDDLVLTGSHVGCEHGVCGACTVRVDGVVVRGCLMLAAQCDGAKVETIEGVSDTGEIADLQRAFEQRNALQCGFCTPGMLLTAQELLANGTVPSREKIREQISGNYCRCTGYHAIVDAIESVAQARAGGDHEHAANTDHSSPRKRGPRSLQCQIIAPIAPFRVGLLDQLKLPGSIHFLICRSRWKAASRVSWTSYQTSDLTPYFRLKPARRHFGAPGTPNEIIGHADIQRAVSSACQDVYKKAHNRRLLGPRFRGDERAVLARRTSRYHTMKIVDDSPPMHRARPAELLHRPLGAAAQPRAPDARPRAICQRRGAAAYGACGLRPFPARACKDQEHRHSRGEKISGRHRRRHRRRTGEGHHALGRGADASQGPQIRAAACHGHRSRLLGRRSGLRRGRPQPRRG